MAREMDPETKANLKRLDEEREKVPWFTLSWMFLGFVVLCILAFRIVTS